ncbi:MAG: hypothetical protein Tsb005_21450 [Gammaproteobacteria bacterium]
MIEFQSSLPESRFTACNLTVSHLYTWVSNEKRITPAARSNANNMLNVEALRHEIKQLKKVLSLAELGKAILKKITT